MLLKKILFLLSVSLVWTLTALDWQLFYKDGITWENPGKFQSVPQKIKQNDLVIVPVKVQLENAPDLNEILKLPVKPMREALLLCEINSKENKVVSFGMGADYWCALYVNGKEVKSNFPKGHFGSYYNRFCYVFPITLVKGRNILALRTRSGGASWQLGAGFNDFAPVRGHSTELFSRRGIINAVLPPQCRVTRGPFIPRLSENSAAISFQVDGLMAAGVEYRPLGSKRWLRQMDAAGGQVKTSLDSHMVTLRDLKPGTVYQYRIIMFPSARSKVRYSKKTYTFTTFDPAAKGYRFFLTADTQIPYLRREATIRKLLATARKTDLPIAFAGHLGDLNNECSNFELEMLRTMELFRPYPLVFVRGNHEYVGAETGEWYNYFAPDGKSYFAFRHGKVFFIVLDSGNNFPSQYGDLNPGLIKEQRKWLQEIIKTPACRTAEFRIVLSHHTNPFSFKGEKLYGLNRNMHQLADKILLDEKPACKIHLWIAGHTHRFLRTTPKSGESRWVGAIAAQRKLSPARRYPFTILNGEYGRKNNPFTGITVDVRPGSLKVDTFLPDGIVLDSFRIRKNGAIENLHSHPGIKVFFTEK